MEPAFQRGDILFLTNQDDPIRAGEIVVFKIKDRDIPIVHRVMKVHEKEDGKVGTTLASCSSCLSLTVAIIVQRYGALKNKILQ